MIIFDPGHGCCLPLRGKTKNASKMKKQTAIILLAAALVLPAALSAGRRQLRVFSANVPSSTVIARAPGLTEFVYDYSFSVDPSGVDDARETDRMLLQTAPGGLSKFTSLVNVSVDSVLMTSTPEQIQDALLNGRLESGDYMNVFKNYPSTGLLTYTDKICNDWFRYGEEMPVFDWTLTDSTLTVLGYECRGATCSFRGREWTVFYAEDIPLSDGPWKLCGLPGLIMEASADGGAYRFECVGIMNDTQRPVSVYDVPYNDTDRHKFYATKYSFDTNPYAYFAASGQGLITVNDENGNPDPTAFDPVPLPYDYIETDWNIKK